MYPRRRPFARLGKVRRRTSFISQIIETYRGDSHYVTYLEQLFHLPTIVLIRYLHQISLHLTTMYRPMSNLFTGHRAICNRGLPSCLSCLELPFLLLHQRNWPQSIGTCRLTHIYDTLILGYLTIFTLPYLTLPKFRLFCEVDYTRPLICFDLQLVSLVRDTWLQ